MKPPKEIYRKHLDEVEESIKEVWLNREKLLIDVRMVKSWHIRNWKERTDESIAKILMHQFKDMNFINGDSHTFSQLLIEDLFGDKVRTLDVAKDFNERTRRGDRKGFILRIRQLIKNRLINQN